MRQRIERFLFLVSFSLIFFSCLKQETPELQPPPPQPSASDLPVLGNVESLSVPTADLGFSKLLYDGATDSLFLISNDTVYRRKGSGQWEEFYHYEPIEEGEDGFIADAVLDGMGNFLFVTMYPSYSYPAYPYPDLPMMSVSFPQFVRIFRISLKDGTAESIAEPGRGFPCIGLSCAFTCPKLLYEWAYGILYAPCDNDLYVKRDRAGEAWEKLSYPWSVTGHGPAVAFSRGGTTYFCIAEANDETYCRRENLSWEEIGTPFEERMSDWPIGNALVYDSPHDRLLGLWSDYDDENRFYYAIEAVPRTIDEQQSNIPLEGIQVEGWGFDEWRSVAYIVGDDCTLYAFYNDKVTSLGKIESPGLSSDLNDPSCSVATTVLPVNPSKGSLFVPIYQKKTDPVQCPTTPCIVSLSDLLSISISFPENEL